MSNTHNKVAWNTSLSPLIILSLSAWVSRSTAYNLSSKCQGALLAHIRSIFHLSTVMPIRNLKWCLSQIMQDHTLVSSASIWCSETADTARTPLVCLISFIQPGQKGCTGRLEPWGGSMYVCILLEPHHNICRTGRSHMHPSCLHQPPTVFESETFCS